MHSYTEHKTLATENIQFRAAAAAHALCVDLIELSFPGEVENKLQIKEQKIVEDGGHINFFSSVFYLYSSPIYIRKAS